jgi:hypothetical protein
MHLHTELRKTVQKLSLQTAYGVRQVCESQLWSSKSTDMSWLNNHTISILFLLNIKNGQVVYVCVRACTCVCIYQTWQNIITAGIYFGNTGTLRLGVCVTILFTKAIGLVFIKKMLRDIGKYYLISLRKLYMQLPMAFILLHIAPVQKFEWHCLTWCLISYASVYWHSLLKLHWYYHTDQ